MAAPYEPKIKGEDLVLYIALKDASTGRILLTPTIAAGDFKISKDGGAFNDLGTLPAVTPAGGGAVKVVISSAENNIDSGVLRGIDQTTPNEWTDFFLSWNTTDAGVVIASGGLPAAAFSAAALAAIADAISDRNEATGTDSGTDSTAVRTPRQGRRALRNKVVVVAGVATVMKEDDVTPSWTAAVTTAAGNPISQVDPT